MKDYGEKIQLVIQLLTEDGDLLGWLVSNPTAIVLNSESKPQRISQQSLLKGRQLMIVKEMPTAIGGTQRQSAIK